MAYIILDDGTTYEVTGFGTPLKGESYIRWDEETCDGPLVNEANENHDSDATPRILLKKVAPVQVIRRFGAKEYEISGIPSGNGGMEDAHLEGGPDGRWVVDIFDSGVEDNDSAHRESQTHDGLWEALSDLLPEAS